LYVGHTSDLSARVDWHNRGLGSQYTAIRRPVQLVHSEEFKTLPEAVARERQLKTWSGQKKEALIAGDSARLKALSKRRDSVNRRHSS